VPGQPRPTMLRGWVRVRRGGWTEGGPCHSVHPLQHSLMQIKAMFVLAPSRWAAGTPPGAIQMLRTVDQWRAGLWLCCIPLATRAATGAAEACVIRRISSSTDPAKFSK
jgi:hypothetical protein